MMLWDSIKHFTIYRKMFFSYLILIILSVILISGILFQLFSSSTVMEINNISQSMLSQTSYASDVIYDQVFSIGNELLHNNEIITALFTKVQDPVLEYNVLQKLIYIKSVYPFINDISLYNGNMSHYLSSKGSPVEINKDILNRVQKNNGQKYYEFFPIIDGSGKVLTFMLYSNFSNLLPNNGVLIINVDEEYIQKIINAISSDTNDTIYVMNSQGTVLSHLSPEYFLQDFSRYPYVQKILDSSGKRGYLLETLEDSRYLITYVKSDKMGWIFVSIKPYNLLLSNINKLKNVTFGLAFALIIAGVFLSVYLTGKLYNPLRMLVKKINTVVTNRSLEKNRCNEYELLSEAFSKTIDRARSMEVSLKTAFPVLKETYLNFLLKGNIDKLPETSKILSDLDVRLTEPYFCVVLFMLDGYEGFTRDNTFKDQSLMRFAICNIAQELIAPHCKNNAVNTEKNHVILLVQLAEDALPQGVYLAFGELQSVLANYFKLSVSVSIGDVVNSIHDIHQSYNSALEYGNYKIFYKRACIIDRELIKDRFLQQNAYPAKIEDNLLEAINLNNREAIHNEISRFAEAVKGMTYSSYLLYFHQLAVSLLKKFDHIMSTASTDDSGFSRLINSLPSFETIDDVTDCIRNFCFEIAARLENKKENKNSEILAYAREYIRENYSNPNLSIELVAEQVHFSPGYLGKLFKTATNRTFVDYVNTVRLEKAKELLLATDEPTSAICEKVGLYNNTYFFTLFKKTYGMTPTYYRNQIPQAGRKNA